MFLPSELSTFTLMDYFHPGNKQHRSILERWRQEAGSHTGITSDYMRWPGGGDASILLALTLMGSDSHRGPWRCFDPAVAAL